jgi:hypothetical protein
VDQAGVTLAFDATTGREVWRTDRVSAGGQSPGVLGGTVFTGDSDPETHEPVILALDATTGDELWRTDREARLFFQGVSDAAGQVYAQAYEGDLVALDPDGGERWRVDPGTGMTWTSDSPAEAEGVLYAATNTGQGGRPGEDPVEPGVVALDPGSGEVIWRTPLGASGGVWFGPVVAGDGLVVAPGAPPVPVLVDQGSGRILGGLPWPADVHLRTLAAGPDLVVAGYQSTEGGFPGLVAIRLSAPTSPSQDPTTALPGRTPAATPIASPTRTPTPPVTPAPDSASLTVRALACPVAYVGNDFAAACAEPLVGIGFRLVIPATELSREGTTDAEGTVAFRGLGENTYALSGGVPAEFAVQTVACADDGGPIPVEPPYSEIPGGTVEIAAGQAVACSWYVVPEDLRGELAASVAVTVHLCATPPTDPVAECAYGDATGVVVDGPVRLTTDATSDVPVRIHGVSWVWGEEGDLPLGTYYLQPGSIAVPAGYELSDVRGSLGDSGNGWAVTVDEANPNARLAVVYVETVPAPGDVDSDADGLSDVAEAEAGSDPATPDTDEDGLLDGAEVGAGGPATDPTLYDTDGDGFGDNQEGVEGSDPLDPASVPAGPSGLDTDGDLLSDEEEAEVGTDPTVADTDGDGLTDFGEVGFEPGSSPGTDPLVFDTDGDGVGDGAEVAGGTDPTDPASA